jgi:predicted aldo/keto reductase-like oxidoreductase
MEPVKGGTLVNLPEEAAEVFAALGGSPASYAIRFAAGFEGIMMVLSGMSTLEMVEENCGFMADFQKLSDEEMTAVNKVRDIFHAQHLIPCTACKYCTEVCPQGIRIPDLFACMNAKKQFNSWTAAYHYSTTVKESAAPADCLKCGLCEDACPQNLKIRDLLEDVAKEFESK